jgi:hypothetical protein
MRGFNPTEAEPVIFANGLKPFSATTVLGAKRRAEAPSSIFDAFLVVTVPSYLKAGRSAEKESDIVSQGSSSISNTIGSTRLCSISKGDNLFFELPRTLRGTAFA